MRSSTQRFAIAIGSLYVLFAAHSAIGADPIVSGKTFSDTIGEQGEPVICPVAVPPRAYVRGSIDGSGLTVWMIDASGNRIRRLANGVGEQQEFRFVVDEQVPPVLEISGPKEREFELRLELVVPFEQQIASETSLASPSLRRLQNSLAQNETSDAFWQQMKDAGTPLVEFDEVVPPLADDEALVTFLYRGERRSVRMFGSPSGDHDELHRLGDSDTWYRSYRLPRTARVDYRLAPDVPVLPSSSIEVRRAILATAQRDPLNPLFFPESPVDVYEGYSIAELPDAPKSKWINRDPKHPSGEVQTHRFTSMVLGNTRDIFVYRTSDFQPSDSGNALIVAFDGEKYANEMGVPTILDNLRAAGKIPPTAAIMVDNPSPSSRSKELPCNDDFARFIADELMPWAKQQSLTASREKTVVTGASFGGLAAAFVALKSPEWFGGCFSQSGSFWWSPGGFNAKGDVESQWLTRQYVAAPHHPVHYFLQAGTFEKPSEILQDTRHLRDCLQAKGYDVTYEEFVGGHGYFYWRHHFAAGIIELLGSQ